MKAAFEVPKEIDYRTIGLRVGLEIHQQLDTKTKLFCNCPTRIVSEEELKAAPRIVRYLRATKSELGEVDAAAAFEQLRGRTFVYLAPPSACCLVELDEEPPHELNKEALIIALAIAKALNAKIVDEVHVMRKIVIDGSNTTGFQRTAIIAYDGYIDDEEGRVRIATISLEEDAARKIEERDNVVIYSLDRMGIPLIEISTGPDMKTPEQVKRVAERIGLLMRLTGKVKRGIGTIRQDINLSIEGSPKIEIKGVQRLELLPKVVENEVRRLVGLKMIAEELKRRGASEHEVLSQPIVDVTDVLKDCQSKLIQNALKRGARVLAVKLPKFDGLLGVELQPNRRFGTELADYAKQWAGVKGLIHSDELPSYGITEDYVEKLKNVLGVGPLDAFVLIVDEEHRARRALEVVKQRAAMAITGIPRETRAANEDGTTRYMRPQPGAARMYPETDVPPIKIDDAILREVEKLVPPTPEEKLESLIRNYGLSKDLALQLLHSEYLKLFEEIVARHRGLDPRIVASVFTTIAGELKKEGFDISILNDDTFHALFNVVAKYSLGKDVVKELLKMIVRGELRTLNEIEEYIQRSMMSLDEVREIVSSIMDELSNIIAQKRERAFSTIMGKVMARLRGRVDGKIVAQIVREELERRLKSVS